MGLRIATNISSIASQRSLSKVQRDKSLSLEKLSSGSRINKAGDDAAGLAISEKLKSDIRGNRQASRNAGDGISLIQTAEGGLNEVNNILIRLRELSVQSASDTIGDRERAFSNMEFQELVTEVDRIAASTKFNDKNLLSGEGDLLEFQIGINNDETKDRINFDSAAQAASSEAIGISGLGVGSKEDAQTNLEKIDSAITNVSGSRARLGALQNRLQSTINNLEVQTENLSAANSRIRDTDIAAQSAELAKNNILESSSTSVLTQANGMGAAALKLI